MAQKRNRPEPMEQRNTGSEYPLYQQVLIISALVGFCCLAWLVDPQISYYFSFFPRSWMVTGVKWGFGIPVVYAIVWIAIWKHGIIWDSLTSKLRRAPSQAPDPGGTGVLSLLPAPPSAEYDRSGQGYARQVSSALEHCGLTQQGARVKILDVKDGPAAARIVISLPSGLRLSRLQAATRDIQACIGAPSLQVESGPEPKTASMIVTHRNKQTVVLRQILVSPDFVRLNKEPGLPVSVGVNSIGEPVLINMTVATHILLAGTTNSGKSWWLHQLIITWLLFRNPQQLRLVLIDPKRVELSRYKNFPHVIEIAYDSGPALALLNQAVQEMERRYELFSRVEAENLVEYRKITGIDLPIIVITADEIADLFSAADKEEGKGLENAFMRLAQKARAAGIHLVLATQRPAADVIPSGVRTNLPTRVCFALPSPVDYRTAFGYEVNTVLTGAGDGLAKLEGHFDLVRFQGVGVGTTGSETRETIKRLLDYWQKQNITPASVPTFNEATFNEAIGVPLPQATDSEDDILDMSEGPKPERATGNTPELLEDRLRSYIAQLAVEAGEGVEVNLPTSEVIAQKMKARKAEVLEVLRQLEGEGWIMNQGAGRSRKRVVCQDCGEIWEWV